jgi:hypothetical protein
MVRKNGSRARKSSISRINSNLPRFSGDGHVSRLRSHVVQDSRLPYVRFTAQQQGLALTGSNSLDESIEHVALPPPPDEPRRGPRKRARTVAIR